MLKCITRKGIKLVYKGPCIIHSAEYRVEAYPCSYLSDIAIRHFDGYGFEGWILFLFRHGDVKDGNSVCGAQYFVPFSKQHGGRQEKDAVDISPKCQVHLYSHTQAEY